MPSTTEEISRLRERMRQMADPLARQELATLPALSGLVQLRAGGSYEVDSVPLAQLLMAGPSRAGGWCAVVGMPEFGVEAAAEVGVEPTRTVLVPEPGELWLEVTAALIDVATLVVVRPTGRVQPRIAEKLGARLRTRGAALVALGEWPRAELRLTTSEPVWSGVEQGAGHLQARRLMVGVQRGSAPARRTAVWFPAEDSTVRRCEAAPVTRIRAAG